MMRACPVCRGVNEFPEGVKRGGYVCKPCAVKRAGEWKRKNREATRAANRRSAALIPVERMTAYNAAYRTRHPEKYAAHRAVAAAIRNGSMQRQPCEVCGSGGTAHAHHDDYSKPLAVIWLCHAHHFERHGMLRSEA